MKNVYCWKFRDKSFIISVVNNHTGPWIMPKSPLFDWLVYFLTHFNELPCLHGNGSSCYHIVVRELFTSSYCFWLYLYYRNVVKVYSVLFNKFVCSMQNTYFCLKKGAYMKTSFFAFSRYFHTVSNRWKFHIIMMLLQHRQVSHSLIQRIFCFYLTIILIPICEGRTWVMIRKSKGLTNKNIPNWRNDVSILRTISFYWFF